MVPKILILIFFLKKFIIIVSRKYDKYLSLLYNKQVCMLNNWYEQSITKEEEKGQLWARARGGTAGTSPENTGGLGLLYCRGLC